MLSLRKRKLCLRYGRPVPLHQGLRLWQVEGPGSTAVLIVRVLPTSGRGVGRFPGDRVAAEAYTTSGSLLAGLHHRYGAGQAQLLLRSSPEARANKARHPSLSHARSPCARQRRARSLSPAPRKGAWRVAGAFQKTSEES